MLINWGCHRDLKKLLNLSPKARVFVVDSHRQIHLHNLSDQNDRVVVLYTLDNERQADLAYDIADVSALVNVGDLNSEDEFGPESDSDSDSDNSQSEEEEEEGNGDGSRKRRRVDRENGLVKLFRDLKRKYYHLGTFHGKPSGCLMYDLSHSFRKNTNEFLWLACVSLTDQFLHERLTDESYQAALLLGVGVFEDDA
ncbi:hypothetical protein ACFX2I_040500 [Malus domestica]